MTKTLVIAAAGTGGHVMPGLAVAKIMIERGWNVHWIGTKVGMERKLVEKYDIPFDELNFQGLRGKGLETMLTGGFKLVGSILRSRNLLKKCQADIVFSTGGYVAVPVCLAAGAISIPYVLMNSDAEPLLSVKLVQGNSSGVLCGFQGLAADLAGNKALITGNPVREEIIKVRHPEVRYAEPKDKLDLLIFGGSLGAKVFNETAPRALALIPEDKRPNVVHQCGIKAVPDVEALYKELGVKAEVVPFIEDMAAAYEKADVVLARAGAISVSELTAAGVPAILVPLVVKTTSHQKGNAEYMSKEGAAVYLPQTELTPERLAEVIQELDRETLLEMAKKAKLLGHPGAATTAANFLEHIYSGRLQK
ncbi:MAG: undecaprenyldiphospho-muramoylpentapeptide beta-N-acetylglucosaminyltransferase [Burkholderiales bacterium]|nr:undecaprenyldiphospho-muramoylpentapeptide beta-N-acetylglucosaminyltransferase [Burkholderiales bacterium]